MKKKLLSLFLILALFLSLAGCGDDTATTDKGTTTQKSTTTTVSESPSDSADDTTARPTDGGTTAGVTDGSTTKGSTTTQKPITTTTTVGSSASGTTVTTVTPTHTTATAKPTTTTATTAPSADKLLVDRAFALAQGETIEGATLTGVVTSSDGYSESFGNATFYIQVEGTSGPKTIYCYRVKPGNSARTEVVRGETVTLSGTIQNYKGTIEFYPANYVHVGGTVATTTTTRPTGSGSATIDENGIYDSKEDVALYIHIYGKLPKNYYPKSEFNKDDEYQCCGGDRFYNKEGLLPSGETYYECDIDTYGIVSRGAKRLVWTKSGIVYYTDDHYASFTQLYGER